MAYLAIVALAIAAGAAPTASAQDPVVAAAGDIACDPASPFFNGGLGTAERCHQRQTSDLLVGAGLDAVLPLGDTQYEDGAYRNFRRSYDPTWGRVKSISRPVVGNHEYRTPAAVDYFRYFGLRAGPPLLGFYTYRVGTWRLIALNGHCRAVGGCGSGSPQERWLRRVLLRYRAACVLAYWHQPRFSSGLIGNDSRYSAFWRDLYLARADVVLAGHDHDYERFAPQHPSGQPDPAGIRQFVVGTGGKSLSPFVTTRPNSEVRNSSTYGVLNLTLRPGGYDWRFVPEAGATFTDAGSDRCH